jgi:hypothetical protein
MTTDEKRRQKADLLLEHQEAEENLAHLQEKLAKIAQSLSHVARWLGKLDDPVFDGSFPEDFSIIATAPRYREAMDMDAILRLKQEIAAAEQRITNLARRKNALGLK